jgi:hypothetical protein
MKDYSDDVPIRALLLIVHIATSFAVVSSSIQDFNAS